MEFKESHFNEMQHKVRTIAGGWILAGFSGIAFFMKTSDPTLDRFSPYTMINLVCLMVVIGLYLLWILDQVVYQRLLGAVYVAGLYKEYKDNAMLPVRALMAIGAEYKGMSHWYEKFYLTPMVTFNVFSFASAAMDLFQSDKGVLDGDAIASLSITAALIVATFCIWRSIIRERLKNTYTNYLKAIGDDGFEALHDQQDLGRIIRNWDSAKRAEATES